MIPLATGRWGALLMFLCLASPCSAGAPRRRAQSNATRSRADRAPAARYSGDPKLIDISGYKKLLAAYRGRPILVNFWATWCEPCRYEFPMLAELARQCAPKGLVVLGVSFDDDADMNLVRRFLARNRPSFPNYRERPASDVDAFLKGVNPEWDGSIPSTAFYARNGQLVAQFIGTRPQAEFERAIQQILEQAGKGKPARKTRGRNIQ